MHASTSHDSEHYSIWPHVLNSVLLVMIFLMVNLTPPPPRGEPKVIIGCCFEVTRSSFSGRLVEKFLSHKKSSIQAHLRCSKHKKCKDRLQQKQQQ